MDRRVFGRLVRLFVATAYDGDSMEFIYVSHPGRFDATLLMKGGESGPHGAVAGGRIATVKRPQPLG